MLPKKPGRLTPPSLRRSHTSLPTITGTAQVGQTLTSSSGSWTNSPTSYSYQWEWFDTSTNISGATGSTYVLATGDVNHKIAVKVTATNASGSSSPATSAATAAVVAASAPSNTALPAITGTAQVGQTLTSSTGSWTNSPTSYSYQWEWFDTSTNISGATGSTYVLATGDVNHKIAVKVTATNASGSSSPATSAATAAVIAATTIPVNSAVPVISGTAQAGQTLTTTNGTWTNSPTSYAYQWYDSDTSNAISGATSSTYVLQASDVGHQIKVSVTAANTAGSSSPAMSSCL